MTDKIFCVFNPDGRAPKYKHSSEGSAKMEAVRLARENPGQKFFVMVAMGVACKEDVTYTVLEIEDGIPF